MYRDLRRAREVMTRTNTGEGIKCVIYDISPHVPCKSPVVDAYYIIEIDQLLPSMEVLVGAAPDTRHLIDRHLAAFIAPVSLDTAGRNLEISTIRKKPSR